MTNAKIKERRQKSNRSSFFSTHKKDGNTPRLSLHPLFFVVGIWYAFKGKLLLFLLSCLVAVQHECAHAFAAAKLGFRLRKIVLMPFGAIIDGDLRGISLKDEIFVAVWGPLCNLLTALFFGALWWFHPTMYAFTDTAYYASLSIALVNLLPAYPLDGGRILKCALARGLLKKYQEDSTARERAESICRIVTLFFAVVLFVLCAFTATRTQLNPSLLVFSVFLAFGAFGNKNKDAVYNKMDFSVKNALSRGVEIRRVAVLASCPVKNALRYVTQGTYLVLEVYDEKEKRLFELSQNELSEYFLQSESPYETLLSLHEKEIKRKIA